MTPEEEERFADAARIEQDLVRVCDGLARAGMDEGVWSPHKHAVNALRSLRGRMGLLARPKNQPRPRPRQEREEP